MIRPTHSATLKTPMSHGRRAVAWNIMIISFLLRRAATLDSWWVAELDPALLECLAQQAFDLGIDAAQVARGKALDRRPQGRVDS